MVEPIKMPFEMWIWVHPRNHILDGGPNPHMKRHFNGKKRLATNPTHAQQSIYSKRLSRGQNQYGVDDDWGVLDDGAHWCNLANTTASSMCSTDVALCH